ncbi:hypothetical protein TWF694_010198 [Orbilia ellipsospora]|uniref:Glycoside hydrolase family 28 protein n=1 Tax=Orbilia ellipsospora TaxID=2528407 RepID=A0AAV9XAB7_9PEZI
MRSVTFFSWVSAVSVALGATLNLYPRDTCSSNNCLRAFIGRPEEAASLCATYTPGAVLPTFAASSCSDSPSKVVSACSCIATATAASAPSCKHDDCLRAFIARPAAATALCASYEPSEVIADFAASACDSAPSRVESACACVYATPTCIVAANNSGSDDTPAILDAFGKCSRNAKIVFQNTTYNVNQVMNTTNLYNCEIEIHGTLRWSTNTTYWLNNSMSVGYQNQSTVWFLGGSKYTVDGFGYGTIDGNGQVWYNLVNGQSNYPHRPMGLTIWQSSQATFRGLRFLNGQMWTMALMHCDDIIMEDIYVWSKSSNGYPARNTDGCDTIYCNNITFRRWFIRNGDDGISLKANSTNILIEDIVLEDSLGIALGSIGQYYGVYETIENVLVRNVTGYGTRYGAYIKTWTGDQVGYPPNGGGGGLGYINNITWNDFTLNELQNYPIQFGQCTTFSGTTGNCDSSLFKIENVNANNWVGDTVASYVAYMQCSKAAGGCDDINFNNLSFTKTGNSSLAVTAYRCKQVSSYSGFPCT